MTYLAAMIRIFKERSSLLEMVAQLSMELLSSWIRNEGLL
jgi:hypothetical protein